MLIISVRKSDNPASISGPLLTLQAGALEKGFKVIWSPFLLSPAQPSLADPAVNLFVSRLFDLIYHASVRRQPLFEHGNRQAGIGIASNHR
jgi:hypothetical protein